MQPQPQSTSAPENDSLVLTDLMPGQLVTETPFGQMFYLSEDDPIGKSLTLYGEWAAAEVNFLCSFVGLGSTVVDVGTNVGTHALAFSRRVGAHGQVFAFEPQKMLADLALRTIETNACANISLRQMGVGRASGEMLVPFTDYNVHINSGGVALRQSCLSDVMDGASVQIIALDSLDLDACHLVKVDVEGMEAEVLEGMRDTIRRLRPVLFLECNSIQSAASILTAGHWENYRTFLVRTAAFNPSNYKAEVKNIFGVACESSILCVPVEAVHMIPPSQLLVTVLPTPTLDAAALALLATPRFGDRSDFCRDPERLRAALDEANAQIRAAVEGFEQRLQLQVSERELAQARVAELMGQVEAARAETAIAVDQVATADAVAARARADADAAEGSAEAAEHRAKRLTLRCASLTAQLSLRADHGEAASLRSLLAAREEEVRIIRNSTSWRLTAPLRAAVNLVRGGRAKQ